MRDVAVEVIPNVREDGEHARVVALLGFDFIASLALTLGYERGSVTGVDCDAFVPPKTAGMVALPIRVGEQGPETDVTIDGELGERFQIDSGGVGGVMITDVFTRRYPGITRGFSNRGELELTGVGGDFTTTLSSVPKV